MSVFGMITSRPLKVFTSVARVSTACTVPSMSPTLIWSPRLNGRRIRISRPASQFCSTSLKAKPSATEPSPRLAKISTGCIDGSTMVRTTSPPSNSTIQNRKRPST